MSNSNAETAAASEAVDAFRAGICPLDELVPYDRNARKHSAAQVDKIVASIREFGFTNPLLVDVAAGKGIVAGHGRRMALRKLFKAGEVIRTPGGRELPKGMVPFIDCSGWSDAQRRAYVIADNRLAEDATWDEELLAEELAALDKDGGLDLSVTGFEMGELDKILGRIQRGGAADGEDDVPDVPVVPISRAGDLWLMGPHRLVCGDSTSAASVSRLLNGVVPLLMVTDPPYGVKYDPKLRTDAGYGSAGQANGVVQNDDRADWREAWALFPGDVAYVWHGALHAGVVQASLEASGFAVRSQIIWVKQRPVFSRGHYHWQHEPALYAERTGEGDHGAEIVHDHELGAYVVRVGRTGHWNGDRRQSTVWQIDHMKNDTGHGTQKPVECMRRPIVNNSSPGQVVYDPFLGSGTTLIAAETEGRACYGSELWPAYVDVIVRRWQEFTGLEATLDGDGRTFAAIAAERTAAAEAA